MRTRRIKVRHDNRKLRSDSRTIPQWGSDERGDGEDHGKWYSCWNCDWPCNIERDDLGGPDSENRITLQAFTEVDEYGVATTGVLYMSVIDAGCPNCGTLNWRGDYH